MLVVRVSLNSGLLLVCQASRCPRSQISSSITIWRVQLHGIKGRHVNNCCPTRALVNSLYRSSSSVPQVRLVYHFIRQSSENYRYEEILCIAKHYAIVTAVRYIRLIK